MLVITACNRLSDKNAAIEHKLYTIKMEKTTGSWVTKSYWLPKDAELRIWTQRGSYKLVYGNSVYSRVPLKSGIVDFEILSIKADKK